MEPGSVGSFGHPVMTVLDNVANGLDKAIGGDVWSLSDDDLAATIEQSERLAARQSALSLLLIREADARDLGRRSGAASMAGGRSTGSGCAPVTPSLEWTWRTGSTRRPPRGRSTSP